VGLASLFGLGLLGPAGLGTSRSVSVHPLDEGATEVDRRPTVTRPPVRPPGRPAQDPQDQPGTRAAAEARRELSTHRALQHVPWRRGNLVIDLTGARRSRAILRVSAPHLDAARRGYRRFLRRFGDDGGAYIPRFRARGGHHG
jgi:hypothetical protein